MKKCEWPFTWLLSSSFITFSISLSVNSKLSPRYLIELINNISLGFNCPTGDMCGSGANSLFASQLIS